MKKRVLIIAKYLYPNDTRLVQQINTLKKNNISTDLICLRDKNQAKKENKENLKIYRILGKNLKKYNFLMYIFKTFQFLIITFFKLFFLSFIRNYKIIIIHSLPEFMVFVTFLQKIFKVKIILDERDVSYELFSSRWNNKNKIIKKIIIFIEKLVMNYCDHVITASQGFKNSIVSRGINENKITVIMNTADSNIFKFDKNRKFIKIIKDLNMIYHGTVSMRFGILTAIEAMSIINNQIPGSKFFIYGLYDLQYLEDIKQKIKLLKLENNVFLNNVKSLAEIYDIIKNMDIGVVPYNNDNFMNLALSTKTFEYVSTGLPVVASRLKSTRELFSDDSIKYFEPGNSKDLAEKIIDFSYNYNDRKMYVDRAYIQYNNFSSDVNYTKFSNIINLFINKVN